MFRYKYSKELSVKPPIFSIWKLNFELPPVQMFLKRQIDKTVRQLENYQPFPDVQMTVIRYPSSDGTMLPCYVLERKDTVGTTPAILYYHGGGFMFPITENILNTACYYVQETGYRVFLPQYRLAPDYSCKVVLQDCYDMLVWLFDHAEEYKIEKERVLIYGDSAGGALSAGVTHMAKDKNGPQVRAQMLIYPVLDHRSECYRSVEQYKYAPWTKSANRHMWNLYLRQGDFGMLNYVSPMNHPDFEGLPPAFIEAEEIDVLRDEAAAYGKKLRAAGVPVKTVLIRGSHHGFDGDQTSPLTQKALRYRCKKMVEFLK